MKLQGRNLRYVPRNEMHGDDVELLQQELGILLDAGKLDTEAEIEQEEIDRKSFGPTTRQAVVAFQQQHDLPAAGVRAKGIVDEATAEAINAGVDALQPESFSVSGHVARPDGTPLPGLLVRAFDHGLCEETELGSSTTDTRGHYRITYTRGELSDPDKRQADLIVKVFKSTSAEDALVSSPLILNALGEETVNLAVGEEPYRGRSEYFLLSEELRSELSDETLSCITERGVLALANKTGIAAKKIAWFVKAKRLEQRTDGKISSEVFYGLFHQQLPTSLSKLVSSDMDSVKQVLVRAINNNIISGDYENQTDEIIRSLKVQKAEQASIADASIDNGSLAELLNIAGFSHTKQRDFMVAYVLNEKPIPDFWRDMRSHEDISDNLIDRLQYTIQLAGITRYHLPLVKALLAREDTKALRDLAKFDLQDWLDIISDDSIGIPKNICGDTEEEQKRTYAQTMAHVIEDAFPTAVLSNRMFRDNDFEHDNFRMFFADNPDFDFSEHDVTDYLAENGNALARISEPEEFTKELLAMRRIYEMSPRYEKYDTFKVCWQNKLHSAHAVSRMGENIFIALYSQQLGGESIAKALYQNAMQINSKTLTAVSNYSISFNMPQFQVIPSQVSPDNVANLETLFGSLDFCECKHCRSVLGPAAYLVDLLMFVGKSQAADGDSGLEKLFQRRPDLGNIALTCANTDTPMPYIDLVNEILENAIVPIDYSDYYASSYYGLLTYPVGDVPQTNAKAPELKANPEHSEVGAYQKLMHAAYPWNLPFNLWGEEAKVYLEHLGVPLYHLVQVFRNDGKSPTAELEIAKSYLCMTELEQCIIAGEVGASDEAGSELWQDFGLPSESDLTQLTAVPTLLKKTSLEYKELLEILKTGFVNPTKKEIIFANDSCALEDATLTLDNDELSKLHRFCRLKQKTDWSPIELDKVITALNPNELDGDFVTQCYYIKRMQEQMSISLEQMLSWWAPIDISDYEDETCLYEKLFLNKTVNNPSIHAFELSNLGNTGDTILNQDIAPIVLSGINVDAADLALMVSEELPDDQLNLLNLSHLYRIASFVKALKITVSEYLSLKALTGQHPLTEVNPPAASTPKETFGFLETFNTLTESGFTIDEMDYLLRQAYSSTSALPPSDEDIAIELGEMRAELQKVISEHTLEGDMKSESVKNNLSLLLEADFIDTAIAIIDGTSSDPVAVQESFIDDHFSLFVDPADAQNQLVDPGILTDTNERFDYILRGLLDYFMQNTIMQKLASGLDLEARMVQSLVQVHLPHPNDVNKRALEAFLEDAFVNSDIEQAIARDEFKLQFKAYEHLFKVALFADKLSIQSKDLNFLFGKAPALGWLNLGQLPLDQQSPNASLDACLRLIQAYDVQHAVFKSASIFDLLNDIGEANIDYNGLVEALSEITGWSKDDIEFLTGAYGYSFTFPTDFEDERWLLKLREAFSILKRIGAPAEQIWSWHTFEISPTHVTAIKNAAKAKHTNERWLEIAPPLRDVLREKQRDALSAYEINDKGFEDASDLYSHYLIDPEMNACAMSSRIKQAISSVQMFVQRILMGLESKITFPPGEIDNWQWMKYYRVWEANRKVFLYPENWIEPELRRGKSEFFEEMENQLLQGEINEENLEQAYVDYLEKLDEVANLEINGVCRDKEQNILHVFGRTKDSPYVYYYRRWLCDSYWTPWEKVGLEIEGNHIIPVVFNRRLYLFWPRFEEKVKKLQDEDQESVRLWKIQMHYSEYRSDKWSSAKISKKFLTIQEEPEWLCSSEEFKEYCFFNPFVKGDELYIRCGYYIDLKLSGNNILIPDVVNKFYMIKQAFKLSNCSGELEIATQSGVKAFESEELEPGEYARPSDSIPENMHFHGPLSEIWSNFQQALSNPPLVLPEGLELPEYPDLYPYQYEIIRHPVLEQVPEEFRIAYPHAYPNSQFFAQLPFFYQGKTRTYFIQPKDRPLHSQTDPSILSESGWDSVLDKNNAQFEFIDMMNYSYWQMNGGKYDRTSIGDELNRYSDVDMARSPTLKVLRANTYYGRSHEKLVLDRNVKMTTRMGGFNGFDSQSNLSRVSAADISEVLTDASASVTLFAAPLIKKYYFSNFFHPYVGDFIKVLKKEGIKGLLAPTTISDGHYLMRQLLEIDYFYKTYVPTWRVDDEKYPKDDIDFTFSGAYSTYNWELFFHAPLLIASRFSQNQKFEEAQKWFHYIFDPTESQGQVPHRFWKIKPFYEMATKAQEDIKKLLQDGDEELEKQIAAWQQNPFEPHVIAQLRYPAYMKTVVMKYLDNLIAWGDHLFRRDTIESINEAAQLYILASQILGKRPVMTQKKDSNEMTFNDLLGQFDILSDQQINLEDAFENASPECYGKASSGLSILSSILYFCVPHNQKLLTYWDTVADRLFKIRNCMNIEGIRRELPLFQAPIEPGLLVKAVAAGVDPSSILNDLYAPLPHYRFQYNLQKAIEMCSNVRELGAALLSALEKRDGEELAILRSSHEVQLLKASKNLKQQATKEAQETLNAVKLSKQLADIRLKDYSARKKIISHEKSYLDRLRDANKELKKAADKEILASGLHAIPNVTSGGTSAGSTFGGSNLGSLTNAIAAWFRSESQNESYLANRASSLGSYDRRQEDWDLQKKLAEQELRQFDKQIASSEIRVAMAEKDLENHELQIENSQEAYEVMRDKFTNQELYDWMISQISSVYFESYQMAYDLAKRAEKAFRHELAIEDTNFIQFGYWDSLKEGLLAGERLHRDLKRMEVAYLEQNKREYELTKHISLAMLNPKALLKLRETGECSIDIPEILFDLDYPGQYLRRIKSVSMTIPCITGPYTNVSCKLTLLSNRIRKKTATSGGYAYTGIEDNRFTHNLLGIQSIATSSCQNDSGMFELNFRDERYLPFEGAGAISSWRLELPQDFHQFDYDTVSDVIIHINYTAREGGEILKNDVTLYLQEGLNKLLDTLAESDTGLIRLFSMKQEFSNELHQFLYPPKEQDGQETTLNISMKHFPYFLNTKTINVKNVLLLLKLKEGYVNTDVDGLELSIKKDTTELSMPLSSVPQDEFGGLAKAEFVITGDPVGEWTLLISENSIQGLPAALRKSETVENTTHDRINPEAIEDIYLLVTYTLNS